MTHSPLTNGIQLTSDSNARTTRVDRFIVHHAATTSLAAILSLFQPGGRTVSANYALGSDATLVLAVDEDRRAWTSASAAWDGRAVTIEVANSVAGGSWPVSDAAFDKLARLIADVAARHGFPINDNTVLTHQELYRRYGASYPTACPGDLERRKGELLALASRYLTTSAGDSSTTLKPTRLIEDDMKLIHDTKTDTIAAVGAGRYFPYGPATGTTLASAEANKKVWGPWVDVTHEEFIEVVHASCGSIDISKPFPA